MPTIDTHEHKDDLELEHNMDVCESNFWMFNAFSCPCSSSGNGLEQIQDTAYVYVQCSIYSLSRCIHQCIHQSRTRSHKCSKESSKLSLVHSSHGTSQDVGHATVPTRNTTLYASERWKIPFRRLCLRRWAVSGPSLVPVPLPFFVPSPCSASLPLQHSPVRDSVGNTTAIYLLNMYCIEEWIDSWMYLTSILRRRNVWRDMLLPFLLRWSVRWSVRQRVKKIKYLQGAAFIDAWRSQCYHVVALILLTIAILWTVLKEKEFSFLLSSAHDQSLEEKDETPQDVVCVALSLLVVLWYNTVPFRVVIRGISIVLSWGIPVS